MPWTVCRTRSMQDLLNISTTSTRSTSSRSHGHGLLVQRTAPDRLPEVVTASHRRGASYMYMGGKTNMVGKRVCNCASPSNLWFKLIAQPFEDNHVSHLLHCQATVMTSTRSTPPPRPGHRFLPQWAAPCPLPEACTASRLRPASSLCMEAFILLVRVWSWSYLFSAFLTNIPIDPSFW